jgi:hypothetical protein
MTTRDNRLELLESARTAIIAEAVALIGVLGAIAWVLA